LQSCAPVSRGWTTTLNSYHPLSQADLADFSAFLAAHVPQLAADRRGRTAAACRAIAGCFGMSQ
jgi:hypothetical protein